MDLPRALQKVAWQGLHHLPIGIIITMLSTPGGTSFGQDIKPDEPPTPFHEGLNGEETGTDGDGAVCSAVPKRTTNIGERVRGRDTWGLEPGGTDADGPPHSARSGQVETGHHVPVSAPHHLPILEVPLGTALDTAPAPL